MFQRRLIHAILVLLLGFPLVAKGETPAMNAKTESAVLGGGCFWCIEAVIQKLKGVTHVESGYAGGTVDNPTYEQVSSGRTGHAEVIRVEFDPKEISFSEILEVFFHLHDPTTLNRQGADVGTQYRSVIFYANDEQKRAAEERRKKIADSGLWKSPIVTELAPLTKFYRAESYHQNYYRTNPNQPYCSVVIAPKIQKLYKEFGSKIRE